MAFITFWRGKLGIYISPMVLVLASLAIGILPLLFGMKIRKPLIKEVKRQSLNYLFIPAIYVLGAVISFLIFHNIILDYPINPQVSDVIPTVQIMSERFIMGDFPYSFITDFGYSLPPTYLTFQWLPFIVSAYFHFDPRFIIIALLFIAFALYSYSVMKSKSNLLAKIFLTALPFLILIAFMLDMPSVFGQTIELLPTSYYIFMVLTFFSTSLIFRAGGVLLPLLSRYSFIFWLPFYFLLQFFRDEKWKSILTGVYVLIFVGLLYIIPFLLKQPDIFKKGYNYYTEAALGEWQLKNWQAENDKPFHLFKGIGFASYFYDYATGSLSEKLTKLKNTHLIGSILVAILMGLLYFRFKNKIPDRLYLLLSLKIYLTYFYAFIQVPYVYLQLVPLFISVLIIAAITIETKKGIVSLPSLFEANNE